MSYELIITEKPAAAKKIAEALADKKPKVEKTAGVPAYKLEHNKKEIVVGCAVGHIYSLAEKNKKGWTYPVFEVEWKPAFEVSKGSDFTKKYINMLKKLSKGAKIFTVATDFDVEGEVIGLNAVRYACKQKDARRMKFSTLTKDELRKSYDDASKTLDWGQAIAGETRHKLDWFYGINISRALTLSVRAATGYFKILSSGRVQGPALKIIVDKEKEIQAFKPDPFWQIQLVGEVKHSVIEAWHKQDKFWDKKEADKVMTNVKNPKAKISEVSSKQFKQAPPVPFDLTSLQIEAYKTTKINPKNTLEIAQNLYTNGWISYPRTSSQKLPKSIGYSKIMKSLSKQKVYKPLCDKLLKNKNLKPNEGKKVDEAHPAIYPTGEVPSKLGDREAKIYDLIVRRFLACFAEPATRETMTIEIDCNGEPFLAKGTRTVEKGWHEFYGSFIMLDEEELPKVKKGDSVDVKDITLFDKETQPPKRYTPASLIKELEKRNLGTKATRSVIVENLYSRGYAIEQSIQATPLGIKTETILEKYIPEIVDEHLTRSFEEEMEDIRHEKKTEDDVLKKAKEIIKKISENFKKKEKDIGKELNDANRMTINAATVVGKCPNCKDGQLNIRKSKFGRFIGCSNYPKCKTTFGLPKTGILKPTDKICPECNHPIVSLKMPRQKLSFVCINPKCPTWRPGYKKSETKDEGSS